MIDALRQSAISALQTEAHCIAVYNHAGLVAVQQDDRCFSVFPDAKKEDAESILLLQFETW